MSLNNANPQQQADLSVQCTAVFSVLKSLSVTPTFSSMVNCCSAIRQVTDSSINVVSLEQILEQEPLAMEGKYAVGCTMDQNNNVQISSLSVNKYPGCGTAGAQNFVNISGLNKPRGLSINGCNMNTAPIPWPVITKELPFLERLELVNNNLTGPIDKSVADLKALVRLDLSNNFLSGPLPNTIVELGKLQAFNISHNIAIYGTIPSGLALLNDLKVLLVFFSLVVALLSETQLTSSFLAVNRDLDMTAMSGTIPPLPQNLFQCTMPYLACRNPDWVIANSCTGIRECGGSRVPDVSIQKPAGQGLLAAGIILFLIAAVIGGLLYVRRRNIKRRNILSRGGLAARSIVASNTAGSAGSGSWNRIKEDDEVALKNDDERVAGGVEVLSEAGSSRSGSPSNARYPPEDIMARDQWNWDREHLRWVKANDAKKN
ncbi:hypothetical protein HDU97_007013 [Phlyctochytrium planicorne]|nr:hypothetical protein HDU97_007013 [Phlyctochytrium planicorne]